MENSALLELADSNLAEANREHARWLPAHQIEEQDDVLFVASGTRFPAGPFNSVLVQGAGVADPQQVVARARAWYARLERGFTIYARAHRDRALGELCERSGFAKMADAPGMVLTERPKRETLAAGAEIRQLTRTEEAPAFVDVVAAAYESMGMAAAVTRKMLSHPARWLTAHWHVRVLYENGAPVAAAMLLFSHGIAGVYWVGTIPSARGRGYADAIMRSISCHAFDRGARAVVLQASPFGEPVYRRLGYREITRYPWYLVPRETLS